MSRPDPGFEADDYLVAHLKDALAADPAVGQLDLDVTVAGGQVFLSGEVATDERRQAAEAVVRAGAGDRPVHSSLTVVGLDGAPRRNEPGEMIT